MSQMILQEQVLYEHWHNEQPFVLEGISYRVGKMSYGDYFLEPGTFHSEMAGFNQGTIWPEVIKGATHP